MSRDKIVWDIKSMYKFLLVNLFRSGVWLEYDREEPVHSLTLDLI